MVQCWLAHVLTNIIKLMGSKADFESKTKRTSERDLHHIERASFESLPGLLSILINNYRQTDRQTEDGQYTMAIPRFALRASLGKNRSLFAKVIDKNKSGSFLCFAE